MLKRTFQIVNLFWEEQKFNDILEDFLVLRVEMKQPNLHYCRCFFFLQVSYLKSKPLQKWRPDLRIREGQITELNFRRNNPIKSYRPRRFLISKD